MTRTKKRLDEAMEKHREVKADLLKMMRKRFEWVKVTKPSGSRKESFEVYLIGYRFIPSPDRGGIGSISPPASS